MQNSIPCHKKQFKIRLFAPLHAFICFCQNAGVQEAVIICLNKQTREAADQNVCDPCMPAQTCTQQSPIFSLKEISSAQCHFHRWEAGQWSSCSTTCGVGLMTRTVTCTHRPSPNSNYSAVLKDEMCQKPKPSPFQACNRFDCPPTWDARDWGQCSQTCGGGVQKRQVFCKQRLADGSILELPDSFCPSRAPDNQRPCGRQDCPPQWVTVDWSQVANPLTLSNYLTYPSAPSPNLLHNFWI
uniref:Uncharacterized protein n=1 Tax=Poecilia reticulata TaxID=8081 RepID=A0A3P9Q4F7_POERE